MALGPEEKCSTIKRIHYDIYYHRVYYVDQFVQMIVYCCAPYEIRSVVNVRVITPPASPLTRTISYELQYTATASYTQRRLNIVLIVCEKVQNVRQHE